MNNLAVTYQRGDQLKEAVELHEKVLAARQRTVGMEHPDTLISMNNLANTYRQRGQLKEAAELNKKVLTASQRILGVEHPDTLLSMNNLATTYGDCGQLKEAAELHEKALAARQTILGMEHPDTWITMIDLAGAYTKLGLQEKAAELYEKLLQGTRTDWVTLESTFGLAEVYWDLSRHEDSIRLSQRVPDLCVRVYGEGDETTKACRGLLIERYRVLGRLAEVTRLEAELA